ncbi:hypothetical protein BKA70DRAFT_1437556 [Coprinopsis sp. MPI-PUGE-AT-0042]|nr:hypothetical protein BKA70DRAFT_1437556 [Coprinopsis sp. MPI-PUGE-AT-0042]
MILSTEVYVLEESSEQTKKLSLNVLESYTTPSDAAADAQASFSSPSSAPSSSSLAASATPPSTSTFNTTLTDILVKDIDQPNPLFCSQSTDSSIDQVTSSNIFDESDRLADLAAAMSNGELGDLQGPLEIDVEVRLRNALIVLNVLIGAELALGLGRDVDSEITKRQTYTCFLPTSGPQLGSRRVEDLHPRRMMNGSNTIRQQVKDRLRKTLIVLNEELTQCRTGVQAQSEHAFRRFPSVRGPWTTPSWTSFATLRKEFEMESDGKKELIGRFSHNEEGTTSRAGTLRLFLPLL